MCQISITNLHDAELNRKLFLLMGSMGSPVHDDGWGFSDNSGKIWKCSLPMYLTSDAGEILRKGVKSSKIAVGHIRQASALIPVSAENAHPFVGNNISFVHNGKLIPHEEKDFIMEDEVEEVDAKTKEVKVKKVKRSDSKLFFEEFLKTWQAFTDENASEQEKFLSVFQQTMDKFYGKFAMVFVINKHTYVCRGRTADLYISNMLEIVGTNDANIIGWAINTDKTVLDVCTTLLSNLEQIDGRPARHFSSPKLLESDTVFLAGNEGLKKIGEVKENNAKPINYHGRSGHDNSWNRVTADTLGNSETNPSMGDTGATNNNKKTDFRMRKFYEQIFKFMEGYSLSPSDIGNFFMVLYGASLLEVTDKMLAHFCKYVIPALASKTNKEIRTNLKKALVGYPVSAVRYGNDLKYPWMLNPKHVQIAFVKKIEAKKESTSL